MDETVYRIAPLLKTVAIVERKRGGGVVLYFLGAELLYESLCPYACL